VIYEILGKGFAEAANLMTSSLPVISTIVLNWNRRDLLEQTLLSLDKTYSIPHELIIIDNGSTDDSVQYIENFLGSASNDKRVSRITTILLEENRGGEAFNLGIEIAQGSLVHLSENDLVYHTDWDHRIVDGFEKFPNLGQLSVFGPVPTDDEAWAVKEECKILHNGSRIIYETSANVGTSSVLRREIIDSGVRISNLPSGGEFKFPDDGRLSREVRAAGYTVAWNDHYLVINLGHLGSEIQSRVDYYHSNYASKEWFRVEGMERRLAEWRERPHPNRSSFIFSEEAITPELLVSTDECPSPQNWSMLDARTPEVETLEFLYALTRLFKPGNVLETKSWQGFSTVAIGKGLSDNGLGHMVTLETNNGTIPFIEKRLKSFGLASLVETLQCNGLEHTPSRPIDLLLLNSGFESAGREFDHFRRHLKIGSLVVFLDSRSLHALLRNQVSSLVREGVLQGFFLPTPRGIALMQYVGENCGDVPSTGTPSARPPLVRRALGRLRRETNKLFRGNGLS
jgi:glycosyltransferase involved in cell wall biosynthesis